MKKLVILFGMGLLLMSCKEDESPIILENTCGVANPITDLPWLVEIIDESSQYSYVVQAEKDGETLFLIANCFPGANSVIPVYNCDGDFLGPLGYRETGSEFDFELLTNGEIIWKSADNKCSFAR